MTAANNVTVGQGPFRYHALPHWGQLPAGWSYVEVAGVATDSHDRVYVFNRGDHPVVLFDRDGHLQTAWGEGVFRRAHGSTIGPDAQLRSTDDLDHTARQFTP